MKELPRQLLFGYEKGFFGARERCRQKVLVKLFQKLAWSSARALAASAEAEFFLRRFLLPSFSLRLSHQRKADKRFALIIFGE